MSYLNQLAQLAQRGIGVAPQVPPKVIGVAPATVSRAAPTAIVAAQPHVEPPPYDAAMDPSWHGILNPADHELRNFLNGLAPEQRQMLLVRLGRAVPATTPRGSGTV